MMSASPSGEPPGADFPDRALLAEPASGEAVVVRVCDETSEPTADCDRIDTERWAGLAAAVLRAEGVGDGELGLRFVDAATMAELNLAHMGAPGPTDVLAFPIDGGNGCDGSSDPAVLLGDVVVCPAYAARAAGADGLVHELALLVVHGVLHVLGYDHAHDEEAAAMQARERRLLAAHHRQP